MPRKPRIKCGGIPHHIIQRGNNRSACFFADEDYQYFMDNLSEGAERYECDVHAYVLMSNHVHFLVTPMDNEGLSRMMRYVGSRYVQYVNNAYRRSGTLWEGRFKSNLLDSDRYLMTCCRYIEMNPVRAALVTDPGEYKWSSYGAHAYGRADGLLRDHNCYLALGENTTTRLQTYRELFRQHVDEPSLQEIRSSINSGMPLGDESFKDQLETQIARSVRAGKPGRPKKRSVGDMYDVLDLEYGVD